MGADGAVGALPPAEFDIRGLDGPRVTPRRTRRCGCDSADLEGLQRERIRTALARKCPKLLDARKGGRVSILVLESDDVALANLRAIATPTITELATRDDSPDVVIWARTSTRPWKAWLLKEGDKTHPNVPMGGPHGLDRGL